MPRRTSNARKSRKSRRAKRSRRTTYRSTGNITRLGYPITPDPYAHGAIWQKEDNDYIIDKMNNRYRPGIVNGWLLRTMEGEVVSVYTNDSRDIDTWTQGYEYSGNIQPGHDALITSNLVEALKKFYDEYNEKMKNNAVATHDGVALIIARKKQLLYMNRETMKASETSMFDNAYATLINNSFKNPFSNYTVIDKRPANSG